MVVFFNLNQLPAAKKDNHFVSIPANVFVSADHFFVRVLVHTYSNLNTLDPSPDGLSSLVVTGIPILTNDTKILPQKRPDKSITPFLAFQKC